MSFSPRKALLPLVGLVLLGLSSPTSAQTRLLQDDGQLMPPWRGGPGGGALALGQGCTDSFLTTHFNSNNGSGGNMFDIRPNINMTIECLDVNVSSSAGSTVTVNLWYKLDTCVGFTNDQNAWTLIGTSTGSSAGMNLPTNIDFSDNEMVFEAGQLYGIFVDVTSGSARYTDGGPTDFTNADLTLTTYYGKSGWGSTYTYREWNGTLYYQSAGPSLATPQLFAGSYGTFHMDGLTEGSHAHFALSIAGLGTTPTAFGDLALAAPVLVVPPVPLVPDASGAVSLTITMPPNAFGRTVSVQGIELVDQVATMTDPVSEVVQ